MTLSINRIAVSLGLIVFMAAVAYGATGAFYSDTETSQNNTFTAGALDLKIDSTAHYNNMICTEGDGSSTWQPEPNFPGGLSVPPDHYPQPGDPCNGTWEQTDLGAEHIFFDLQDVKPGDEGEDTISLHVYDNDAWGQFNINNVEDNDNSCTEPEGEDELLAPNGDPSLTPSCSTPEGELAENLTFFAWLDQGAIPGFQNVDAGGNQVDGNGQDDSGTPLVDSTEGDNIQQCGSESGQPTQFDGEGLPTNCDEPTVITPGPVDQPDESHNIWEALVPVFAIYCPNANPQGDDNYDECQGIASDGRLVGSTTYYFGLGWTILDTVGNEIQTDSLDADIEFVAVQHRNNPDKEGL